MPSGPNETVSFLTLNLRFGLADDGPNNWTHRKSCYPIFLKNYRSDFLFFQEVNDFQGDFLKTILSDYGCIGRRSVAPIFWQNNMIFYHRRWRCIHYQHFYLSHTPTIPSRFRESRWPRQCTLGIFEKPSLQVTCVTTHLDFDESVQLKSTRLILEQLSNLRSSAPIILAGDFNATPSGACHRLLTRQSIVNQVPGPVFINVFKEPFPGTYHRFTGVPTGDHIDWILYSGRIAPESARVIEERFDGKYLSDHFPVQAVFRPYHPAEA